MQECGIWCTLQATRKVLLAQLQEARLRSARLQTSLRTGAQVAVANKLLNNSAYVDRKVQTAPGDASQQHVHAYHSCEV